MTVGGGALGALVAAASVTQLVQFGGRFSWNKEVLEASVGIAAGAEPNIRAAPELRYCLASEAEPQAAGCIVPEPGFLEDPGEQQVLYGSNAITLLVGVLVTSCIGGRRCIGCRRWFPPQVSAAAEHGRGAVLRERRARGRGRLQIAGAGPLGSALV